MNTCHLDTIVCLWVSLVNAMVKVIRNSNITHTSKNAAVLYYLRIFIILPLVILRIKLLSQFQYIIYAVISLSILKYWSRFPIPQRFLDCDSLNLRKRKGFSVGIMMAYVKVKVKFTLVHALRFCTCRTAHRGSRGINLFFLDHGTRWRWVVSVTPRPLFTPRGKTRYPLYRRLGGPQDRSGRVRKILPTPTWIRSPDRPARSQSLYRLRYPAHLKAYVDGGVTVFVRILIEVSWKIHALAALLLKSKHPLLLGINHLAELQRRSGNWWEERKFSPLSGIELDLIGRPAFSPVTNIDWTTSYSFTSRRISGSVVCRSWLSFSDHCSSGFFVQVLNPSRASTDNLIAWKWQPFRLWHCVGLCVDTDIPRNIVPRFSGLTVMV